VSDAHTPQLADQALDPAPVQASVQRFALHTEHVVSVLLGLASLAVLLGANNIRIPLTSNVVDPRFVPRVVGVLLGVCAIAHGFLVAKGDLGTPDEGEDVDLSQPPHWKALLIVSAAFIAHTQLIRPVGWPIAAIVLFGGASLGLGARRIHIVLLSSIAVAVTAFVVFRIGLGVFLPAGPFERWMPAT
jgi:putative tricarboxylic transport membrane protein